MRLNNLPCALALGVMAGCGGGTGSPSTGNEAEGGGGNYVQYAVMAVMGDPTSGVQPYTGGVEVDYDSASYYSPMPKLGHCEQLYKPMGSADGDTTRINCGVSAPSVQGHPDAGGVLGTGGSASLDIVIKGKPSSGLEVTQASPSLVSVTLFVFDAKAYEAGFPSSDGDLAQGQVALSDFSLKITSAKAIPSLGRVDFARYVLDAEAHATTIPPSDNRGPPGSVSVSLTMSASRPTNGALDGGVVVGTCADLTACCNAIADATAKTTCSQLESTYQGMVGAGFTQMQADLACSTFLQLERKGLLCP